MMTRDEMARRQAAFQRDANRRVLPAWLVVLFLTTFLPWGLGGNLRDSGGPKWVTHALGATGFVGVLASVWWFGFRVNRFQRAHQLVCPHCGNGLAARAGRAALKTGRCGRCETVIVADPTGEPVSPDPAARKVRDRRLVRLTMTGCAVGLLFAWAAWVPLKLMGEAPSHLTWPVVVLFPLAAFGWVTAIVVLPVQYPRRATACLFAASAVALVVAVLAAALSVPGFFDLADPARQP